MSNTETPPSCQPSEIVRRFEACRAAVRPRDCIRAHPKCWVRIGPGAMSIRNGGCHGCHGHPDFVGNQVAHTAALVKATTLHVQAAE